VPAPLGATRTAETILAVSLSFPSSISLYVVRVSSHPHPRISRSMHWTAPCISEYKLAYFRARRDVQWQCRLASLAVTWIRSASAVAASPHYLIDSSLINTALRLFNFTEASYACVVNCQPVKRTSRTMRDVETRMMYQFWQNRSRNIFNR